MKIIRIAMVTYLWLMMTSVGYAAASATNLANLLNELRTMRADFTQTIYDNHGKVLQKSYGRMALERPGKFRWEVTKPIPQLIVANATRLWVYDPDLEQVTIKALHQAAGESPAMLLSHENAAIDKDYVVTEMNKATPGAAWFSLVPRSADSMLSAIRIGFMNKELHEMQLDDHLGRTTKIQFQHAEMNSSISAALFTFKKPANVDVIDETKKR